MSVDIYLACHKCQKRIHLAQDGLSGWTFYSGERDCMKKLGEWFEEHHLDHHDHRFVLVTEHTISTEDYPEIEWTPNWIAEKKGVR